MQNNYILMNSNLMWECIPLWSNRINKSSGDLSFVWLRSKTGIKLRSSKRGDFDKEIQRDLARKKEFSTEYSIKRENLK